MRSATTELTIFDYLNQLDDDLDDKSRILISSTIYEMVYFDSTCLHSTFANLTPLEYAVMNKKPQAAAFMVKLLCDFKSFKNPKKLGLPQTLSYAIQQNDIDMLRQLLKIPAKIDLRKMQDSAIQEDKQEILQVLLQNALQEDFNAAVRSCVSHNKLEIAEYLIKENPAVINSFFSTRGSESELLCHLISRGIVDYAKPPDSLLEKAILYGSLPFLKAMVFAKNQQTLSMNPALQKTLLEYAVSLAGSPQSREAYPLFEYLTEKMKTSITLPMYFDVIAKKDMEMFEQLSKADATLPWLLSPLYLEAQNKRANNIVDYLIEQYPDFPAVNQAEIANNPKITPEYKFTETNLRQYFQSHPLIAREKILPLLIKHNQWSLIASQLIAVADNAWWMSTLLFVCIEHKKTDFALFLMNKKPAIVFPKQQNVGLLEHIIEHVTQPRLVGNASDPLLNELEIKYKTNLVGLIKTTPIKTLVSDAAQKNLWHFLLLTLKELQNSHLKKPVTFENELSLMQGLSIAVNANHLLCAEMIMETLGNKVPSLSLPALMQTAFENKFPQMMHLLFLNASPSTKLSSTYYKALTHFSCPSQYARQYFPIKKWVEAQQENWLSMQGIDGIMQRPELFNKYMEAYLLVTFALLQVVLKAPDASHELKTFIQALVGNNDEYHFKDKIKYPGSPAIPSFDMKMLAPDNLNSVLQHPDYLFLQDCKRMLNHIYALYEWLSITRNTITGSNWQIPNRIVSGYKQGMPDNMRDIEKVLQNLDKLDHPFRIVGLYFHVKHLFMQIPEKDRHPDTNAFYRDKKSELLQHKFPMQPLSVQELFAKDMAIKDQIDEFEVMEPSEEPVPDPTVEVSKVKKPGFWEPKKVGPQAENDKKDKNERDDPGLGL